MDPMLWDDEQHIAEELTMSPILGICLTLACVGLSGTVPFAKVELPAKTEKAVRDAVCGKPLLTGTAFEGEYAFVEVVAVPRVVKEAYATDPEGTFQLLLRIADGARAEDSVAACGYLLALTRSPVTAVVVPRHFDASKFDEVDVSWKLTPRQHWIAKAKQGREEQKKKGK